MDSLDARLQYALLPQLEDVVLELGLRLLVHLFDAGGMDTPVLQELLERQPGDLPANAVEPREHYCSRRVIDDEVDAGQVLQRADVAPLPTDDAPLHVIGGEMDDRYCVFGCMAGGESLHANRENVAHPPLGLPLRLLLDLAKAARGVVLGVLLDLLHQHLLGARGGQPRGLLQRALELVSRLRQRLALLLVLSLATS